MDIGKVQKKVMTLVYIRNEDKVLLGMKKRGFGQGKHLVAQNSNKKFKNLKAVSCI